MTCHLLPLNVYFQCSTHAKIYIGFQTTATIQYLPWDALVVLLRLLVVTREQSLTNRVQEKTEKQTRDLCMVVASEQWKNTVVSYCNP